MWEVSHETSNIKPNCAGCIQQLGQQEGVILHESHELRNPLMTLNCSRHFRDEPGLPIFVIYDKCVTG